MHVSCTSTHKLCEARRLEDLRNKQAHLKTFFALAKKTHHPRRLYFLCFFNERRRAFETHPQGETRKQITDAPSRDARGARSPRFHIGNFLFVLK